MTRQEQNLSWKHALTCKNPVATEDVGSAGLRSCPSRRSVCDQVVCKQGQQNVSIPREAFASPETGVIMASIVKKCSCQVPDKCQHAWVIRYRDHAGKQREETRTSNKTDAKHRATQLGAKVLAGEATKVDSTKFGDYARQVIEQRPMSDSSRRRYLGVVDNHLNGLTGMRLAAVAADRDGVRKFLTVTLPAKGLARSTIEIVSVIITSTLNEAVRSGRIPGHNLSGIKLPPVDKRADFEVASKDEVEALAVGMGSLSLAVYLAYGCGLRLNEALGVKRSDIHGDTLTLARQVTATTSTGPLKARRAGEVRDIPIPAYVAQKLAEHVSDDDYLFGFPHPSETSFGQAWRDARKTVKPGYRFHDLRHCYASFLLGNGVDLPSVSKWLGHRDVSITARVYAHSLPKTSDKARELLDEAWAA